MVWGWFAASVPGQLALIEGTMNSALYQRILQENVRPSVCELKRSWVMQQDNDPKHTITINISRLVIGLVTTWPAILVFHTV